MLLNDTNSQLDLSWLEAYRPVNPMLNFQAATGINKANEARPERACCSEPIPSLEY